MEPTAQKTSSVPNPDDRPLPLPPGHSTTRSSVPSVPRTIINPDERLLPFPADVQKPAHQDLKVVGKSFGQKVRSQAQQITYQVKKVTEEAKRDWVHWGISFAVVAVAAITIKKIFDK